jgi:DNA-binding transcriptional regulator YhcF (GntR family)
VKPTAPVARYEQIARDLRRRILDGDWAAGVTLPGAPTLAREYDVTQSVAQKALEVLVAWRLARTGAGRGTVVLPLADYRVEMVIRRPGGTEDASAVCALRDALAQASQGDPVLDGLDVTEAGSAQVTVSAVLTAAHAGRAADQLAELVRDGAPKGWTVTGAPVTATPA